MASPTSSMSDVSDINNESFIGDVEEDYNVNVREQCGHQQQMANGSTIEGTAAYQDEVGECQENQSQACDSLYSAQDRGTVLRPQTPPLPDNLNCLPDDMASLSISGGGKQPEIDLNLLAAIERQRLELDRFKEAHLQQQCHQQVMMMNTPTSHQSTPQHMPTHSFTNVPSNIREVSCPQQASSNVSNITSKSEALSKAYEMQRKEYERLLNEHMIKRKYQQNSNQHEMVHSAALYNQKQQQQKQQSINHQEVTGSAAGRMDRSSSAGSMSSSLVQNDKGGRQTPQTPPPNYTSMHNHLDRESTHHTYQTRQGDRSGEMIPPTTDEEEELSEEVFNHYLDVFNQTKFNPAPGF